MAFEDQYVLWLPPAADCARIDRDYWVRHGVNLDDILENRQDEGWLGDRLGRLGLPLLRSMATWLGYSCRYGNEFQTTIDFWIQHSDWPATQLVLCILEFLFQKQRKPIEHLSSQLLSSEQFEFIRENLEAGYRRFAYVLLIFFSDPENLRFVIFFDQSARQNFGRYLLNADIEGYMSLTLDEAWVNDEVLPTFSSAATPVRCVGVFTQAQEVLVFVKRALRETSVPEVERYVFAKEAELIVLRFTQGGTLLEEHSQSTQNKRPIGVLIAEAVISKVYNTPYEYEAIAIETDSERIAALFHSLEKGLDTQLSIREVRLSQATMIDGNPALTINCDKTMRAGISRSLRFLRGRGIELLGNVDLLRSVGLSFRPSPDPDTEPFIFNLYFTQVEDGYRVRYSGKGSVSSALRRQFETYMKDHMDVSVVPVVADSGSPTIKAFYAKQVLREGITITADEPNEVDTVYALVRKHVVTTQDITYVKCAWPADPDYPNVDLRCDGWVVVDDDTIPYECPECQRVIDGVDNKRHFKGIRVSLDLKGTRQYLQAQFKKLERQDLIDAVRQPRAQWETLEVDCGGTTLPVFIVGVNGEFRTNDHIRNLTFAEPYLYVRCSEDFGAPTIIERARVLDLWDIFAHERDAQWLAQIVDAASYSLSDKPAFEEVRSKLDQAVAAVQSASPSGRREWEAFEQWFMPLFFECLQKAPDKVNQYLRFLRSLQGTIFGVWSVPIGGTGEPDWIALDRYDLLEQMLQLKMADAKYYGPDTKITVDVVREAHGHLTRLHGAEGSTVILASTDSVTASAWREVLDYRRALGKWRVIILPLSWLIEMVVRLNLVELLDEAISTYTPA